MEALSPLLIILAFAGIFVLGYLLLKTRGEFRKYRKEEAERISRAGKEAIERSRRVLGGRFTEQMTPYLPDFKYDPTEARFIGTPLDFIVFPGLSAGEPEEIVFIEVKTGKSDRLPPRERKVRELVEAGKVRWELIYRPSKEPEEQV
jgi:predicted Holliday junction resolvase-like endonuclease